MPLLAALLTLHPLTAGEFVSWDDLDTVARNPSFNPATLAGFANHWTRQQGHLYIPLTYSTWHVAAMLTQRADRDELGQTLDGRIFSSLNLGVHLVAVVLTALILLRLTGSHAGATIGATLVAIHPLQVEAVGWISGLKDVLSATLSLAAVWVYLLIAERKAVGTTQPSSGTTQTSVVTTQPGSATTPSSVVTMPPSSGTGQQALLWLLVAAAMLAKPTATVLPAMLLTLDVLLLRRPLKVAAKQSLPLLALSIPAAIITALVQQSGHVDTLVPWMQRPLVALDSLGFYLGKLLWPTNLTIDYGRTPQSVIAAGFTPTWLLPIVLLLAALLLSRRAPWVTGAALLAVLPLAPVLGFVPFDFQYISGVADHYVYPSMFGVAVGVAFLLRAAVEPTGPTSSPRRVVALALSAAALVALGRLGYRQAHVWRDTPSLMNHAMRLRPESWLAPNNLASHLLDRVPPEDSPDLLPRLQEAEQLARRAIARRDRYAQAHNNLGYALFRQARIAGEETEKRRLLREAARAIRAALDVEPRDLATLINAAEINGYRAALDEQSGDLPQAMRWLEASIAVFSKVLEIDPRHEYATRRIAQARAYRGRLAQRLPTTNPQR